MAENQTALSFNSDLRILRINEVIARTGLSRTTLYESIAKGEFPHPIAISMRCVGWVQGEVDEWIAGRIKASRRG